MPGTPEAEDAVLIAQIPTTVTVNAAQAPAEVKVSYVGEPQFQPIAGTTMMYATNTPNKVIQVGNAVLRLLSRRMVCFLQSARTVANGTNRTAGYLYDPAEFAGVQRDLRDTGCRPPTAM